MPNNDICIICHRVAVRIGLADQMRTHDYRSYGMTTGTFELCLEDYTGTDATQYILIVTVSKGHDGARSRRLARAATVRRIISHINNINNSSLIRRRSIRSSMWPRQACRHAQRTEARIAVPVELVAPSAPSAPRASSVITIHMASSLPRRAIVYAPRAASRGASRSRT